VIYGLQLVKNGVESFDALPRLFWTIAEWIRVAPDLFEGGNPAWTVLSTRNSCYMQTCCCVHNQAWWSYC
jgi:hypothetical protein